MITNQRSKVQGGVILLVRKGNMLPRVNIAYTEETLVLKESFDAKGIIPPQVERLQLELNEILLERIRSRLNIQGRRDLVDFKNSEVLQAHQDYVKMMPPALAHLVVRGRDHKPPYRGKASEIEALLNEEHTNPIYHRIWENKLPDTIKEMIKERGFPLKYLVERRRSYDSLPPDL